MSTVEELEAQLEQAKQAAAEQETQEAEKPVVQQVAEVVDSEGNAPVNFLDKVRAVAGRLSEQGKLLESDLVSAAESPQVQAVLVKYLGEIAEKVL